MITSDATVASGDKLLCECLEQGSCFSPSRQTVLSSAICSEEHKICSHTTDSSFLQLLLTARTRELRSSHLSAQTRSNEGDFKQTIWSLKGEEGLQPKGRADMREGIQQDVMTYSWTCLDRIAGVTHLQSEHELVRCLGLMMCMFD